eukprot:TRINITY_DN17949_c0_g1_i1.p1 TRINITY_DN17949_c0_g1~~TRINITY_DN17949_c0_g1_i1.p1  ORF type:complete len:345 (+),score=73.92 TRINITY_DN17949_c0_g1_i1:141-1175(+)
MVRKLELTVTNDGWVTIRSEHDWRRQERHEWQGWQGRHERQGWQERHERQGWQERHERQGWQEWYDWGMHGRQSLEEKQPKERDDKLEERLVARIAKLEGTVDYLMKKNDEYVKAEMRKQKEDAEVIVRIQNVANASAKKIEDLDEKLMGAVNYATKRTAELEERDEDMMRKWHQDADIVMKIESVAKASAKKIEDIEDQMKHVVQFKAKLDTLIEHMRETLEYKNKLEELELKPEGADGIPSSCLAVEPVEECSVEHCGQSAEKMQSIRESLAMPNTYRPGPDLAAVADAANWREKVEAVVRRCGDTRILRLIEDKMVNMGKTCYDEELYLWAVKTYGSRLRR